MFRKNKMYNERIKSVINYSSIQSSAEMQGKYDRFKKLTQELYPGEVDIRRSIDKLKNSSESFHCGNPKGILSKIPSMMSLRTKRSETDNSYSDVRWVKEGNFERVLWRLINLRKDYLDQNLIFVILCLAFLRNTDRLFTENCRK